MIFEGGIELRGYSIQSALFYSEKMALKIVYMVFFKTKNKIIVLC